MKRKGDTERMEKKWGESLSRQIEREMERKGDKGRMELTGGEKAWADR